MSKNKYNLSDEEIIAQLSELRWICLDCYHSFPIEVFENRLVNIAAHCPKCLNCLTLDVSHKDTIEFRIEEIKKWKDQKKSEEESQRKDS